MEGSVSRSTMLNKQTSSSQNRHSFQNKTSLPNSKISQNRQDIKPATMVGCGGSSGFVKAAFQAKKIFFYVGNIDPQCTEDGIKSLLLDKDIRIGNVFKINSEHSSRYGAFRISINYLDKHIFLDPKTWPDNVVVRHWIFNRKSTNQGSLDPKSKLIDSQLTNGLTIALKSPKLLYKEETTIQHQSFP